MALTRKKHPRGGKHPGAKHKTPAASLVKQRNPMLPFIAPRPRFRGIAKAAQHWYVPASNETVHWGYFSRSLPPIVEIGSEDCVTLECLTHQAGDDPARMILGDQGVESVYRWTKERKAVNRRGAGPLDAPNGAGGGEGVHILTGPVRVRSAQPGDVLEVRILDMRPRPSGNPRYRHKTFGTNLAANWGFHYHDLIEEPKLREVVTIYEIDTARGGERARPLYNYRWGPVTDPDGVLHTVYDYPGLIVDPGAFKPKQSILKGARIPIRPHFGTLGLAPAEADLVSSIPPTRTGGNVDDWRIGKGATIFLPVAVEGALLSVGDPHAAQGDSELCGTAIESSWTGVFQVILHPHGKISERSPLAELASPVARTRDAWIVHGFSYPDYLAELVPDPRHEIFKRSSIDRAMRDAYRKMRDFLMRTRSLSEDEAISLISVAVDFGITQVVDGNWGVRASLKKEIFAPRRR